MTAPVLLESSLPLPLFSRGKVRDTYDLGDELLVVTTDRISAFDYVLPNGIPDKGCVLNRLSAFWFEQTSGLMPNHLIESVEDVRLLNPFRPANSCFIFPGYIAGRSMLVRKAKRIPVECVVRGYITGSAWSEYARTGRFQDFELPRGLEECQQLPQPIFSPTTKAETGHDKPLTRKELGALVGTKVADELESRTLAVYSFAEKRARKQGVIIADTKFEFGMIDDRVTLIDEILTPDSSRFWSVDDYQAGHPQPSFDKQPVRDWLLASGWNLQAPVPELPEEVVEQTSARYREAYRKITGKNLGS